MGGFRASPPLFQVMYNPGTTAIFGPQRTVIAPWCQNQPDPTWCKDDECIRGSSASFDYALKSLTWTMSIGFSVTFVSLKLVICRVLYNERLLRHAVKCTKDNELERKFHMNTSGYDTGRISLDDPDLETCERAVRDAHLTNKVITAQCFGYLGTWFLSISYVLLTTLPDEVQFVLMVILLAGQAFCNMIIFVSHKVYNFWRLHREESICDVLEVMFTVESVQEPCFISRISIVEEELGYRRTLTLQESKVFQHPDLLQDASREAFNDESDNIGIEDRSQINDDDFDIADITDLSGVLPSSMSGGDTEKFEVGKNGSQVIDFDRGIGNIEDFSRLSFSIDDSDVEKGKAEKGGSVPSNCSMISRLSSK